MKETADYRDNADECRAIASNMKIPDLRALVLDLARQWDNLAEEREKLLAIGASLKNN